MTNPVRKGSTIAYFEHFRYKLNENDEKGLNQRSIEGHSIGKEWTIFDNRVPEIEKYVRSKTNPNGVLDFEKFIPATQEVLMSSKNDYEKTPIMKSKVELDEMNRESLINISKSWGIDPTKKKEEFLIKLILEKQNEFIKNNSVEKVSEPEINNEEDEESEENEEIDEESLNEEVEKVKPLEEDQNFE